MTKPVRRILVTNDDGIDAPGLKTARKIAQELSDDVWVVAPAEENSGASHSLSLTRPMRLVKRGPKKFAVSGTPTDCVAVALRHILFEDLPDLVLSGVNFGQNICEDVSYSGTVAGAKEGTVFGIKSVALSQAMSFDGKRKVRFAVAERHGAGIIRKLISQDWPAGTLMNVNFPDVDPASPCEIVVTKQGKRDRQILRLSERRDPRDNPYFWYSFDQTPQSPPKGTDMQAIYNGQISITPLKMDHTDEALHRQLGKIF